jgi:hypothetical protein
MEIFWDTVDHVTVPFREHEPFREWQHEHPRGWVLNIRESKKPMLHRSLCSHVEDHSSGSLTTTPMICDTDVRELREYAKKFGGYEWCPDC